LNKGNWEVNLDPLVWWLNLLKPSWEKKEIL